MMTALLSVWAGVTTMTALIGVWAGVTTVLIVLLIYRSTLNMHEDDQLFLNDAESHLAKEQQELTLKLNKTQPWVRVFGAASILLIVALTVMKLYELWRLNQTLP